MRQAQRVFWMIVDQGVFATSNFIMNVLFARWLSAAEYGLFAVSFSTYLLLTVVHWGAFLEPLLVLSAQIDSDKRRSYVVTLGWTHVFMVLAAGVIASIIFVVASLLHAPNVGWVALGAGVGGSLMLTLLTARRLCLVFMSPRVSAIVGLTYFCGVLASGAWLSSYQLSWFTLWELMGFWSLICSLTIFGLLMLRTTGFAPFPMRKLFGFQRRYAPGAIVAALCQWCSFDGVYLLVSHLLGLPAVAETRAICNVANPLVQVSAAMHASWLVLFSEQRRSKMVKIGPIIMLYVVATVACVVGSYYASDFLVQTFYGGRYLDAAWQLPIYVSSVGAYGLSAMVTSLFKARGGLWQGFAPVIIGALVAIGMAVLLIHRIGQPGAVYAMCCSGIAVLAVTGLIFRVANPKPVGTEAKSERQTVVSAT
jgi:O-antigen/teichoic acid export membrane protein